MKSLLRNIKASAKRRLATAKDVLCRSTLRIGLSRKPAREWFNKIYNKMSAEEKSAFHTKYWDLYRSEEAAHWNGRWGVAIESLVINLPLKSERMWLDWDHGISLLGHDMEIKNFYANMLRSPEPPEIFFDVGANYGTHSLLFSCLGVPAVTFEPNSSCHPVYEEMCVLNGVKPRIEHVAIAAKEGVLELRYPEKFTWLGSVKTDVSRELSERHKLICEKVTARPLDDYRELLAGKKALIKIDTEGNELEVFKGAAAIMAEARPVIVFESNHDAPDRGEIAELLQSREYDIYGLQLSRAPRSLSAREFVEGKETNFVAWPKERSVLVEFDSVNCFR